ncbi:MAG: hypothetical protein M1833_002731 [Piccolia ochrophora]|nr:MAG: hypothetical protein M1833_002731 [Piccolia ochrophora]
MFLTFVLVVFSFSVGTFGTPSPDSTDTNTDVSVTPLRGGSFAKVAGRQFSIDGETTFFSGTNAWYLSTEPDPAMVDETLNNIAKAGMKAVRVWGFADANEPTSDKAYFRVLNSTGSFINEGPDGIQRLDHLVSSAEKHGVRVVLPLVNYWAQAGGGMIIYNNVFGGTETSWYTDEKCQEAYRYWIQYVTNRYKNSPAIFSWQLANEPRCTKCELKIIREWARTTSAYIKSLDSNHMVSLGDEGWLGADPEGDYPYKGSEGIDWVENLGIDTLDYHTVHMYPESWGQTLEWGSTWIKQHDDAGASAGKVVVMEEYGADKDRLEIMLPWQETILKSDIAMDMSWQIGGPAAKGNVDIYSISVDNKEEFNTLGKEHARKMYAKSGGRTGELPIGNAGNRSSAAPPNKTSEPAISSSDSAAGPAVTCYTGCEVAPITGVELGHEDEYEDCWVPAEL